MKSTCEIKGFIELVCTDMNTGKIIGIHKCNTVVNGGKTVLARSIANEVNSPYDFYIAQMVFGTGGEDGNVQKTVDVTATALYHQTTAITATSSWDPTNPTRATFIATLGTSDANGLTINEAGLKTADGSLFSMSTFPGLTKTSNLQFTLNWTIVFA